MAVTDILTKLTSATEDGTLRSGWKVDEESPYDEKITYVLYEPSAVTTGSVHLVKCFPSEVHICTEQGTVLHRFTDADDVADLRALISAPTSTTKAAALTDLEAHLDQINA